MLAQRNGDWILTYTGRKFFPLDPLVDDIDIIDIAHSLSNQCRFAGHCTKFYSVAQHCIIVAMMSPDEHKLHGLLNDSAEAYLVDIPSPLKRSPEFKAYRNAEARVMTTICQKFGLEPIEPPSVKLVDKRMLATEARDMTINGGLGWESITERPYDFHVKPWTPKQAKTKFLTMFDKLTKERQAHA
jgi:hypothetical protein